MVKWLVPRRRRSGPRQKHERFRGCGWEPDRVGCRQTPSIAVGPTYDGGMANTEAGNARTAEEQTFWYVLHGNVRYLLDPNVVGDHAGYSERGQVAREALQILHAQAHEVLDDSTLSQLIVDCPIDPYNIAPLLQLVAPDEVDE